MEMGALMPMKIWMMIMMDSTIIKMIVPVHLPLSPYTMVVALLNRVTMMMTGFRTAWTCVQMLLH